MENVKSVKSVKSQKLELNQVQQKEYERQFEILTAGTIEVTPLKEFEFMLKKSIVSKVPLRVKCGIDPTNPDVHLGHSVPYSKMRQFQDCGHIGIVVIGDYTASIGDPTGKNEARPSLSVEEIKLNANNYFEQVKKIIDIDKTELSYQSEWFNDVNLSQIIRWASETTVAKLLSHETFAKRLAEGQSLSLHELFYPLLQGLDSVFINADVELGGSDQKFNVLMGRDYQKNRGQRPQVAMLLPLLTGTCGKQKMSKSLGNYISINDTAFDKFGKIMSIPDNLMQEYFLLIGRILKDDLYKIISGLKDSSLHPNEVKKDLAQRIVSFYHGDDNGILMRKQFEEVFKKGGIPDNIPIYKINQNENIVEILVNSSLVVSKKEARRLIIQNAISFVDGNKIIDPKFIISSVNVEMTLKIGKKKFLKLV